MFGHGHEIDGADLDAGGALLDAGSQAGLSLLRKAAEDLPKPGQRALLGQLSDMLAKRLRLDADRAQIGGIAGQVIDAPFVICGMPRSGTSLLHALLAEHPAYRAPRAWELMTPSPPLPDSAGRTARIAAADAAVEALTRAIPDLLAAHPYWDEGGSVAVECEDIMQLSFVSPYFGAFHDIPDYTAWLIEADHRPAYAIHRHFLQHLQWSSPPARWVLKGVCHGYHLDRLLEVYPDARLIWPHRDPADQFASLITLIALTRRAATTRERRAIFEQQLEFTARSLEAGFRQPLFRSADIFHVAFADLNRDPIATVRAIHRHFGEEACAEHERNMAAWLANPANDVSRHGRIGSDLSRFDASIDEVRDRFAFYYESGLLAAGATAA